MSGASRPLGVVGCAIQKKVSRIFFRRYVDVMERLQAVTHAELAYRALATAGKNCRLR